MACSSTRCVAGVTVWRVPSVSWIRGRSTASGLSRSCPPSIRPIARPCVGSRVEPRRLSLSSPSSRLPGVDVAAEPGSVPMERTSIILWPLLSGGGARELEGLSLVVGLAVLRALESLGVRDAGLKWPNDLLQGGKKIAGILLELSGDPADLCHVVIGIGINVNMKTATDIGQPWTSLREALGELVDRSRLLSALNRQLADYLDRHSREGFAASREEWESCNLWQGAQVILSTALSSIEGRVLGVDSRGALRLEVDGVEQGFSGGELSLRLRQ